MPGGPKISIESHFGVSQSLLKQHKLPPTSKLGHNTEVVTTMSSITSASSGRPISVLERARALEAKCAKPAATNQVVETRRISSSSSKVGNTSEAGSDGAPQPHSTAATARDAATMAPRASRYASIARLLDDANSSTVEAKPAQDVTKWPPTAERDPANNIPSSSSGTNKAQTITKLSLKDKIASDKTKTTKPKTSVKRPSSSSSGSKKLNNSSNTTPAFLSRAVASWNKTEKYFDPLDSDPSSSSDDNANGDDDVSDDGSECSAASTNCTGSTHTSVTNSFTAASSVTSATTGGDATANSSSGAKTRDSANAGVDADQDASSESEDDDELSGYSGVMFGSSRGSRVGISTRPVSIDSPPQVIRSKMPRQQSFGNGNGLIFSGYQSSDDETAIHDNTTSGIRSRSISSSADNSATIDESSTSLFSRMSEASEVASKSAASPSSSSSETSNGSVDSTEATVTRRPADKTTTTRVVTPDNKTTTTTLPPLTEDNDATKLKPLWQCRLEDMRLRQKLMKELVQDAVAASSSTPTNSSPRRTKLPVKMHRQVVAGEEDWSKDFADDAFVAFDDDIFGRSEM